MTLRRLTPEQIQRWLDELPEEPPEDDALTAVPEGDGQDAVPDSVYRALFTTVEVMSEEEFQRFLDSRTQQKNVN